MELTAKVMRNRTRPVAMRTLTLMPKASRNWAAILAAMVWWRPASRRCRLVLSPGDMIMSTAIVSPRARPSPSMEAEMMPERAKGRTAAEMMPERAKGRTAWRTIS